MNKGIAQFKLQLKTIRCGKDWFSPRPLDELEAKQ